MKLRTTPNSMEHDASLRFRKGLTLIEILVVVVMVAVLAALAFVGLTRTRQAARSATCMSNVRQVGMALLERAGENGNKLMPLQGAKNNNGTRPPVWTYQLALAGYLTQWNGKGDAPCSTGVWTCPECIPNVPRNFNYGGFGVVENSIFVYEENSPTGVTESGSLRLSRIADPVNTWLVGDATRRADDPRVGWYAIWPRPAQWKDHGPAARHGSRVNVCMVDGHVESLTIAEITGRKLTEEVLEIR